MSDPAARLNTALQDRYRIERELGAGGMATVYLAEDLKHDRQVALKVLRPELAAVVGAERFLAEIRTTANLQHPHILPLFDSGEADGFLYYAMPYVEGETLRDRLDRERQLPVEEAVAIARKVAGALRAAHEQGVVHRDIKPANILLQRGEPVVSDFGIALAVSQAGGERLTETGLSLGTPYYMAPEQATADRDPDQRSDLYSLGCVLYEMLAGDPPYTASTAQGVLAKLLTGTREPVETLRPSTPPHVAAAIDKALERLPADRFTTVTEFAEALAHPSFRHGPDSSGQSAVGPGPGGERPGVPWLVAAVLGAAALAAVAWGLSRGGARGPNPMPDTESRLYLGDGLTMRVEATFALAPGGDRIVFTAVDSSGWEGLWIRDLADEEFERVPSTRGASFPFWSPDGRSIGFTAAGQIRMVDLDTEGTRSVCPVGEASHAEWTDDGSILYENAQVVHRASGDGASCEALTSLDDTDGLPQRWPTRLPDGSIVFGTRTEAGGLWIREPDGSVRMLQERAGNATFVAPDWLIYHPSAIETAETGGSVPLLARRIDLETGEWRGEARPLATVATPNGDARYSVDAGGLLVVSPFPTDAGRIAWVARDGTPLDRTAIPNAWTFDATADGRRVALGGFGLWVWDRDRGTVERLPPGAGGSRLIRGPAWSPGDSLIAYGAALSGPGGLFMYRRREGVIDTLVLNDRGVTDVAWRSDGAGLAYRLDDSPDGPAEIWYNGVPPGTPQRLFEARTGVDVFQTLAFSPDGDWLLYSEETDGRDELFVRRWPISGAPRTVTESGGTLGVWSQGGDTIFYASARGDVMAVPFAGDGMGGLGTPTRVQGATNHIDLLDVGPGNEAFLRWEQNARDRAPNMKLVTNWIARAEGRGR